MVQFVNEGVALMDLSQNSIKTMLCSSAGSQICEITRTSSLPFYYRSKHFTRLTRRLCKGSIKGPNMQMLFCFSSTCRYLLRVRTDGSHELAAARDSRLSALSRNPFIGAGRQTVFILFLSASVWPSSERQPTVLLKYFMHFYSTL